MSPPIISIVIPTFSRNQVLVETVEFLLGLPEPAAEILVVDQTPEHDKKTDEELSFWVKKGKINWIRLDRPSIPQAMNMGLAKARNEVVLFLDDDILPGLDLVREHTVCYSNPEIWAVTGQVLQPGENPCPNPQKSQRDELLVDMDFCFCSDRPQFVRNVMACNLSVRRKKAMEVGGFDLNFVGSAYRFETEFARRIWRNGGKVLFQPRASVRHLRARSGGTRSIGSHLTSASPLHGVGDYYFALRQGLSVATFSYLLRRPVREVRTRFHLKHPWWIPVKLVGEIRALLLALRLNCRGPQYLKFPG